MGLEPTLKEFISNLVTLFREARRVLRSDGVLWLNMGDCYATSANGRSAMETKTIGEDDRTFRDKPFSTVGNGLKNKDLVGQPWRLAFALQDDGWYLRSDCIWSKPNPMPESIKDRPTKAHEYVFLLTKSEHYWIDFENMKTPVKEHSIKRLGRAVSETHKNAHGAPGQTPHSMLKARPNKQDKVGKRQYTGFNERYDNTPVPMAHPRTVWTVPTVGFEEGHFATFPVDLIHPLIEAGCPSKVCSECKLPWERWIEEVEEFDPESGYTITKKVDRGLYPVCECNASIEAGIVHDPFMGSGTVAAVAMELGLRYSGSELNPDYINISKRRLKKPFEKVPPKPDKPLYTPPITLVTSEGEITLQQMEIFA